MNKNFAIRGHLRRGDEVIKILEMIGGKTSYTCRYKDGFDSSYFFFINTDENFSIDAIAYNSEELKKYYIFTLEEFLEKFPYKVGDRVQHKGATSCGTVYVIEHMEWTNNHTRYEIRPLYDYNHTGLVTLCAEDLQPYKEEYIEGVYAYNEINCYHQDFGDKVRIRLGNNFEIKIEDNVTYIVKKQPEYPKTYEECCKVLFPNTIELGKVSAHGYKGELLTKFGELLICRDAYWKIAGEQMGLGKPWEPDWLNKEQDKYVLYTQNNVICSHCFRLGHFVLAFPTEEMRDVFYENFKDLIEKCKELL